jgi:hypothetical protein
MRTGMKVHIVVTDGEGNVFEGDAALAPAASGHRRARTLRASATRPARDSLDYSLPARAFMTRYGRSVGGPAKFTLLLASLMKGKVGAAASVRDIAKAWNRMKEPMGGPFNSAHPTRAKGNGWVDTPKHGSYTLLPGWTSALGRG